MDYKEILTQYGFKLYEKCNCHGAYTEKYSHVDKVWTINAIPSRRTFNIFKHGFFTETNFIYKLEITLNNHGILIQHIQPQS